MVLTLSLKAFSSHASPGSGRSGLRESEPAPPPPRPPQLGPEPSGVLLGPVSMDWDTDRSLTTSDTWSCFVAWDCTQTAYLSKPTPSVTVWAWFLNWGCAGLLSVFREVPGHSAHVVWPLVPMRVTHEATLWRIPASHVTTPGEDLRINVRELCRFVWRTLD